MRTAPMLAVAVLVGALAGGLAAQAMSGTPEDARRAAEALVPASATVTERSEERITPFFGGQYVVVLRAEPVTLQQLEERVASSRAEIRERVSRRNRTVLILTRGRVDVDVSYINSLDRVRIQAVPDEPSRLRAGAAGAAVAALAVVLWRRRRRRRPGPPTTVDGP